MSWCTFALSQSTLPTATFHKQGGAGFNTFQVPGSTTTIAYGVNNKGDIVGYSDAGNAGFLYSHGNFQTITCPGAVLTTASAINDNGIVVGYCGAETVQGFIYQDGSFTYLNFPGATSTFLFGINNQGEISGQYVNDKVRHYRAFVYSGGIYNQIKHASAAVGLNASDTLAAYRCLNQLCSGELYLPGKKNWDPFQQVMFPGATSTVLNALNDNGDLAGFWFAPGQNADQGFVYVKRRKKFTAVNVENSDSTQIFGINNAGEIVGTYAVGQNLFGFYGQISH